LTTTMRLSTLTSTFTLLALGLSNSAWAQADEARAKKIAGGSCFLCHGAMGESTSEIFPRLAGQHAEYIAKQLNAFQSGERKSTAMAEMVKNLKPDEMLALGRYYEKMNASPEPSKEPLLASMGEYIYRNGNKFTGVPACVSCHGEYAQGTNALPRLATQIPAYIHTQLKSFTQRKRTNDNAVMHLVAEKMTELEMIAVGEYVSTK
jgi:cytochrome c553